MLRLISWTFFLLVVIAELGFLIADATRLSDFEELTEWSEYSSLSKHGHEESYWSSWPIYYMLIVQIVLVFVVPVCGPAIVGIMLVSTIAGGMTWFVYGWEPIEEHYYTPYTPHVTIDGLTLDSVAKEEWTEVDSCIYSMIDCGLCFGSRKPVTSKRIRDVMKLLGFESKKERDEFATVVLALLEVYESGGEYYYAKIGMKGQKVSNRTLAGEGYEVSIQDGAWMTLEAGLSQMREVCFGNSQGTAFQYLLYFKLLGEKYPDLEREFPTWTAAYDTFGKNMCKRPLATQRTFISFALIGFIGLVLMSGIGCCYCPALDEKLPKLNFKVPGAGMMGTGQNEDNVTSTVMNSIV